jgi:type IV pilus assembly protein PilE
MNHPHRGFTLIEVMIVVAIVAILTALAFPSYTEYIRRGHRAEARAALLQASQWMERAATATGTYPPTASFPTTLTTIKSGRYTIAVASPPASAASGTAYTLTATPAGGQQGDKCGNYTLTHTGVRGAASGALPLMTECWNK